MTTLLNLKFTRKRIKREDRDTIRKIVISVMFVIVGAGKAGKKCKKGD